MRISDWSSDVCSSDLKALNSMVGDERVDLFDATDLATRLVGDAVGTNLFLVGFAWQRGLLPLSFEALDGAIALNGVAVSRSEERRLGKECVRPCRYRW